MFSSITSPTGFFSAWNATLRNKTERPTNPARTDVVRVKHLITLLDTEMKLNEGNIQVVYFQHATAKELATVLSTLPGQQSDA